MTMTLATRLGLVVSSKDETADRAVTVTPTLPDGRRLPDRTPGARVDVVLPNGLTRQYSFYGGRWDVWSHRTPRWPLGFLELSDRCAPHARRSRRFGLYTPAPAPAGRGPAVGRRGPHNSARAVPSEGLPSHPSRRGRNRDHFRVTHAPGRVARRTPTAALRRPLPSGDGVPGRAGRLWREGDRGPAGRAGPARLPGPVATGGPHREGPTAAPRACSPRQPTHRAQAARRGDTTIGGTVIPDD